MTKQFRVIVSVEAEADDTTTVDEVRAALEAHFPSEVEHNACVFVRFDTPSVHVMESGDGV